MFPPTSWQEIEAYDHAEVVAGFRAHERGDLVPGPNHSDGFRWGWQNAHRDTRPDDDGFDAVRRAYIRESGAWRRTPTGLAQVIPS